MPFLYFLTFLGDLKNENSVLEWVLNSDNRELDDAIEAVNEKMLSKLLQSTPFMAVFFCEWTFWFSYVAPKCLLFINLKFSNHTCYLFLNKLRIALFQTLHSSCNTSLFFFRGIIQLSKVGSPSP